MRIVFFTHPKFMASQSMPKFTSMLVDGMKELGHEVVTLYPKPYFYNFTSISSLKKWFGYIDQYIIFPFFIKKYSRKNKDVLYVFIDQALGPWIPYVSKFKHVVHCHDFLAQKSALGIIQENKLSYSGIIYQSFIKNGYTKAKNFISVSIKTKSDLESFLKVKPVLSEVVYNPVNPIFKKINYAQANKFIVNLLGSNFANGFILHVGGNQWYKNRIGIVKLYEKWRLDFNSNLPLLLIGAVPNQPLKECCDNSKFKNDIHILSNVNDETIVNAYSACSVFLFPSLAEGFGWPIVEAMACGSLVITTNEAPMSEVGSDASFYLSRMPFDKIALQKWISDSSKTLNDVLTLDEDRKNLIMEKSHSNVNRFQTDHAIKKIEEIYKLVLNS